MDRVLVVEGSQSGQDRVGQGRVAQGRVGRDKAGQLGRQER